MKTYNCKTCGKEFASYDKRGASFCSPTCYHKHRATGPSNFRICPICGGKVAIHPSRPNQKYCSTECYSKSKRFDSACAVCGKEISVLTNLRDRKKYCSVECRAIGTGRVNTTFSMSETRACVTCGKEFTVADLKAQGREFGAASCSQDCAKSAQSAYARKRKGKTDTVNICRKCGKEFTTVASRSKTRKYCGQVCAHAANSGKMKASVIVKCVNCGKDVKKFRSRVGAERNTFCGNDCYHAWDKQYKSTPKMLKRMAERIANGEFANPSKLEDRVSDWLTSHGITHQRQVKIGHYTADFKIGNRYVEIHGCFWHGCSEHYPEPTPEQKKRQYRDKSLKGYCEKRNIPLLIIWEHELGRYGTGTGLDCLYEILAPYIQVGLCLPT